MKVYVATAVTNPHYGLESTRFKSRALKMYADYMASVTAFADYLGEHENTYVVRLVEVTIPDPEDDVKVDNDAVIDHISHHVYAIDRDVLNAFPALAETHLF